MAGITLEQAQAHLDAWLSADLAVAQGQSYAMAGRSLTRADASEITAKVNYWSAKVAELQSGGTGGRRVRFGAFTP